jgi:HEAT repeat protein
LTAVKTQSKVACQCSEGIAEDILSRCAFRHEPAVGPSELAQSQQKLCHGSIGEVFLVVSQVKGMPAMWRFFALTLLVVATVHLCPATAAQQDGAVGVVKGKTAVQWAGYLKDTSPTTRLQAVMMLADFGPEAKVAVVPLMELLRDKSWLIRGNAAATLGRIGPAAEVAVPLLVELMRDEEKFVRLHASFALGQIGAAAKSVSALRQALQDPDVSVRMTAAMSLGLMGPAAKEAEADLTSATGDVPPVRLQAALALCRVRPGDAKALAILIEFLRHPQDAIRVQTARALGTLGEQARPAIPELTVLAKEPNETVSTAAANAIQAIQKATQAKDNKR